ncbi:MULTISPECIES: YdcF family protein [unclassified Dolichospermum]|uniref:YdcF family protein n=1 Tax=unclassified Dolichospermum TaxID=2622029 RepID=UPI001445CE56|nr:MULTISPECIES: YdcF family protein [unclassified Dolichospermum]MTJ16866.1 YdcF family protein [Dolichospermum sp. UHCC 0299]MTJ41025.1 YdcF family protein [Dolichospermum sp. UHCC 0406]
MKLLHCKIAKYVVFASTGLIMIFLSIIPIRIAIASYQAPYPQVIFTLGGGSDREKFTAEFGQNHPNLDIWISSGAPPAQAFSIFQAVAIPTYRIHLDYRAVDTVTNFTTLVKDFQQRHIQHIYLITSDFHLPRAKTIATLVLGSQGITFTPISIPTQQARESILRIVRDSGRSLLWIVSGRTGASFNPRFRPPFYAFRQLHSRQLHTRSDI